MDRLIHKPQGSIDERLRDAEDNHGKEIVWLMLNGWSDRSIALKIGFDEYTINRFRKKYELKRKFRADGVPIIEETTIDYTKLERFGYSNPYH